MWCAEIDKVPDAKFGKPKIGQHLLGVHRKQRFDRFQFEENSLLNNQISTITLFKLFFVNPPCPPCPPCETFPSSDIFNIQLINKM
jgi:hypothetical protein